MGKLRPRKEQEAPETLSVEHVRESDPELWLPVPLATPELRGSEKLDASPEGPASFLPRQP